MPENFLKKLPILLKHYREASSLTQEEVASKIQIGDSIYQRIETGEAVPSLDIIIKLARLLKFNLRELFLPTEHS